MRELDRCCSARARRSHGSAISIAEKASTPRQRVSAGRTLSTYGSQREQQRGGDAGAAEHEHGRAQIAHCDADQEVRKPQITHIDANRIQPRRVISAVARMT